MPILKYTSQSFPTSLGPLFENTNALEISWAELVWASITVGRADYWQLVEHGFYSLFQVFERVMTVFAYLKALPSGNLTRTGVFASLDPSDKGVVSYRLGLTTAKLKAERLLDAPWLMHLDTFRTQLQPSFLAGSMAKPDLVGRTRSGKWIVIEAKGRSQAKDAPALTKAKAQTRQLATIAGVAPWLRIAHQSFFRGDALCTEWHDPDDVEDDAFNLDLSSERFRMEYASAQQRWVIGALSIGLPVEIVDARYYIDLLGTGVRIGVPVAPPDGDSSARTATILPSETYSRYSGGDGLLVELGSSWSDTQMELEPQERSLLRVT